MRGWFLFTKSVLRVLFFEEIQVSRKFYFLKKKLRFINAVFSSYHGCWLRYPETFIGFNWLCLFIYYKLCILICTINMIAVEASIKQRILTLIFKQICLNSSLLGIISYQWIKHSNWFGQLSTFNLLLCKLEKQKKNKCRHTYN